MKIRTFLYTLWQGIRNMFKNGWYSLASVATIGACLFLLGLFYSIVSNAQHILYTVEEGVTVTVFFKEEVSDAAVDAFGQELLQRPEVRDVVFHSDEEIWATFGPSYFGEDYQEGFPENPMKGEHNYEIYLKSVSMQDQLVTWLQSRSEVRLVRYSEVTASTLSGFNGMIVYVSAAIILILLAVSIFLISNTVRVGISVRSEEIGIMKYIGATDFFVRAPFVLEGMMIGLIGALIPLYLIYYLYDYVLNMLTTRFEMLSSMLSFLSLEEIFGVLMPVSILIGVGMGLLGSYITVRKYLKV
ncbi:MAG: permease-like cell division protein FtsX [Lachnospiraceae bacterium]|nr:permease-like cell division protein FtsX [Lachnospiraceae bacterium]